jgi:hypothetical protein
VLESHGNGCALKTDRIARKASQPRPISPEQRRQPRGRARACHQRCRVPGSLQYNHALDLCNCVVVQLTQLHLSPRHNSRWTLCNRQNAATPSVPCAHDADTPCSMQHVSCIPGLTLLGWDCAQWESQRRVLAPSTCDNATCICAAESGTFESAAVDTNAPL